MSVTAPRRRRWPLALGLIVAGLLAMAALLTSAAPWVDEPRHASAEQVTSARALANAARASRASGEPVDLVLQQRELDAISAMVSQGFAPNRFAARVDDGVLTLTGSRPFLFRWINIRAQTSGTSDGIPSFSVRIGAIALPDRVSQWGLRLIRERMASPDSALPPIDTMVRRTVIGTDRVTARVLVPQGSLLARASATGTPIDEEAVARIYCTLTEQQRSDPELLLAHQLRRALAASDATGEGHAAALVALALLSLGPEAGELAQAGGAAIGRCAVEPAEFTLHGRNDWAKHWALSAALETAAGNRISTAIGEWKELADTLARGPLLAPQDPSGFSFVDLASDRAGIVTAQRLLDPEAMAVTRARLLRAKEADLLPEAALALSDGLSDAQFAKAYGATDDPRFARKVESIDAMLRQGGIGR